MLPPRVPLVMLYDLFTSFTTRCSPYLRRMGYLDEALAMRNRCRRRRSAWQPHLDCSKQFLLASAEKCPHRNKVVILGSGLLLDVPLAELSARFRQVVLMDVVCLPEVRKQLRAFPNVSFIEHEVTGVSEQLYKNKQQALADLPEVPVPSSRHYTGADLVVSLNVLSQLWVVPRSYAVKQRPRVDPELLEEFCSRIVESHYSFLRSLRCAVCLIADHSFVKNEKNGNMISSDSSVYRLALPEPDARWTWNIAPFGSDHSSYSKDLIVGAWHLPTRQE